MVAGSAGRVNSPNADVKYATFAVWVLTFESKVGVVHPLSIHKSSGLTTCLLALPLTLCEDARESTEGLFPSELLMPDLLNHCKATACIVRARANPHLLGQPVVGFHDIATRVQASGVELVASERAQGFKVEGFDSDFHALMLHHTRHNVNPQTADVKYATFAAWGLDLRTKWFTGEGIRWT
jgi:hypothetical protein